MLEKTYKLKKAQDKNSEKRNKMTKSKIIFLCMVLLLSVSHGFAQDCDKSGTTGELEWCLKDGTLTISGDGEMPNYTFSNNMSSAPWYDYREYITNVVISNGVTTIGKFAFINHDMVVTVDIPTVSTISWAAFAYCSALASIEMPSVTIIENYAFSGCISLYSISIPYGVTTIGDAAFFRMYLSFYR